MADGVLIEEYKKIKPLEDRLETLETKPRFFPKPFFIDYRTTILNQITLHARKIGADIVAIKKETPASVNSDWYMELTYYKLRG